MEEAVPEELTEIKDQQALYACRFAAHLRAELKPLVTRDLIEGHRQTHGGRRSDALERLLAYFRSSAVAGKYAILAVKPFAEYRIVALSGCRGIPPLVIDDQVFTTVAEAQHGVFLKRVDDLLRS